MPLAEVKREEASEIPRSRHSRSLWTWLECGETLITVEVMTVSRASYETLLAEYSSQTGAIAVLRQYRPYLEKVPSMRRPKDSLISVPLPIIQVQRRLGLSEQVTEAVRLPCDVAILMCDPEWKIKTGVEIFVFIHRPHEDFSQILERWRQTQMLIHQGYEWIMPQRYRHILNDGAEQTFPLFVVFPETPERIKKGLKGAYLPVILEPGVSAEEHHPALDEATTAQVQAGSPYLDLLEDERQEEQG